MNKCGLSRNNWLSLEIDQITRENLHIMTSNITKILFDNGILFNPMPYDQIHMTGIFIGEELHKLNSLKPDIIPQLNHTDQHNKTTCFELKFIGFQMFPPAKRNIIVAKYQCSEELKKRIQNIVNTIDQFSGLNLKQNNNFDPHITLGKIDSSSVRNLTDLEDLLKTLTHTETLNFSTKTLHLCGAINARNKHSSNLISQRWYIQL